MSTRRNLLRLLTVILLLSSIVGCAGVSQSLRGNPDIPPEARGKLVKKYVGKTAWLRYDRYEKEYGHPTLRKEAYKIELPAWSKVTIKEILFGKGRMNFINVIDENGKTHYGFGLDIPTYTAIDKTKPDFRETVYNDYEYAINRIFAFADSTEQLKIYTEKYGEVYAQLIMEHKITIGMPKEAVIESWGRPNHVSRTITQSKVFEQWIYGNVPNAKYVYFENDVVVSMQD